MNDFCYVINSMFIVFNFFHVAYQLNLSNLKRICANLDESNWRSELTHYYVHIIAIYYFIYSRPMQTKQFKSENQIQLNTQNWNKFKNGHMNTFNNNE